MASFNRGANRLQILIYPPQPNFGVKEWTLSCPETQMQVKGPFFDDSFHRLVRMIADTEYIKWVEADTLQLASEHSKVAGGGYW